MAAEGQAGRGAAAEAAATGIEEASLRASAHCRRALVLLAAAAFAIAGCGSGSGQSRSPAGELRAYIAAVEPLRLAVNRLLDRADPILEAYREHRIGPPTAQRRFGRLERRFAAYAARVAAIRPVPNRRSRALFSPTRSSSSFTRLFSVAPVIPHSRPKKRSVSAPLRYL